MATYGAESSILNKDIAKWFAGFERNASKRMFEGTEVHENWRMLHNKELLQLFEYLDILSFVGIIRLNWIGHVNRMDNKRKEKR